MPEECVIDTTVLQKANAPITVPPSRRSLFVRRIGLLVDVQTGRKTVLISEKLLAEYERKLPSPRNDYIRAFFEIVLDPARRIENWAPWPGGERQKARKCRFPKHDAHVLRTAIRPDASVILTEDQKMLDADACIYRAFRVHIRRV